MRFIDRLAHAWNAFRYGDQRRRYDLGVSSGWMPGRQIFNYAHERSIIASIYNRLAVDASSISIRHVRVDQNGRYLDTIDSTLNERFSLSANIDQTSRAFFHDVFLSLLDEGYIAILPTGGQLNTTGQYIYEIESFRVAEILEWFPQHVRLKAYNEKSGMREESTVAKSMVAIVENPFYSVMNEPNSTLKRLVRKLNLLDQLDENISSNRLDLILQFPYTVRSDKRREQANDRIKEIQQQLANSQFGIAYTDATEKIIQLNRPVENAMLPQIEYLTKELYGQLGLTDAILNGSASEEELLHYESHTIEPIVSAVVDSMKRTFLTKTARSQGQSIMAFRDPFKLSPASKLAEMADTFIRNEILTANEFRGILAYRPDDNPKSDQLANPNMPQEGEIPAEEGLDGEMEDDMTEEDFQEAFAELDAVDAELDDLEASLDLTHYASPYYDPVKAHEYYMRTRELRGRKSTAGLNEKGKEAAQYVREELSSERKRKQTEVKLETDDDVASVRNRAAKNLESARERKKQQIANHKATMDAKISSLRKSLEGLKGDDRKAQAAKVSTEVAGLREANKKVRDELNAEYSEYSARVRANRSEDISDLRSESSAKRKQIKSDYDEKYISELERIKADPSMLRQKKSGKSGSTRKSVRIKPFGT